jgi:hypothetical protein
MSAQPQCLSAKLLLEPGMAMARRGTELPCKLSLIKAFLLKFYTLGILYIQLTNSLTNIEFCVKFTVTESADYILFLPLSGDCRDTV